MTRINQITIHNIFLFDQNSSTINDVNPLKEFFNFLKYKNKKRTIDFCYSCEKDSLHQNLSIKENFILDAVPKSLIRDGEDNLKQFLKTLKNPHLKTLIAQLEDLSSKIDTLNPEQLKLASVIKSLLSQSEYIFLLNPDQHLSLKNLQLIKKGIQFEVYHRHRNVVIKAKNRDLWMDISGQIISKCHSSFQFSCKENPLLANQEKNEKIVTLAQKAA